MDGKTTLTLIIIGFDTYPYEVDISRQSAELLVSNRRHEDCELGCDDVMGQLGRLNWFLGEGVYYGGGWWKWLFSGNGSMIHPYHMSQITKDPSPNVILLNSEDSNVRPVSMPASQNVGGCGWWLTYMIIYVLIRILLYVFYYIMIHFNVQTWRMF